MFGNNLINDVKLGLLLNRHKNNLRNKRVSTLKINKMIEASLEAG